MDLDFTKSRSAGAESFLNEYNLTALPVVESLGIVKKTLSTALAPIPIVTLPLSSMRNLSLPPVSTVNVSAAGNLIELSVSPECDILSGI